MTFSSTVCVSSTPPRRDLVDLVDRYFAASIGTTQAFFTEHSEAIAGACQRMAARFAQGGALLVFGEGPQASDAHHVAVEFVHPVIVGKRALPAIALTADAGVITGFCAQSPTSVFASALTVLGTPNDIALALCSSTPSRAVLAALEANRERGILTILLAGGEPRSSYADVCFAVPGTNRFVVQEVLETLYHVLWELVHVFFDDRPATGIGHAVDPAQDEGAGVERQLYPFLYGSDSASPGPPPLLSDVAQSTRQKGLDVCGLRAQVCTRWAADIASAAEALAARAARGGRLLAFGNGGSATDAQDAAADCMVPPLAHWTRLPALALPNDIGVVTGVANDVGFDHVFSRQIVAFGRPQDVALGFSTSGTSRSVITALEEAKSRGLLTIALTGNDGGALVGSKSVDFCVIAGSDYVPRIQEAHATVWHALFSATQAALSDVGLHGSAS